MTRFQAWARKLLEKLLDRWTEGPEPPPRLETMVRLFARANPRATVKDWVDFAAAHAGEAYRSGYARGLEYAEREPGRWRPDLPPEVAMEAFDPDWRDQPSVFELTNPDDVVAEARDLAVDGAQDMRAANALAERQRRSREPPR